MKKKVKVTVKKASDWLYKKYKKHGLTRDNSHTVASDTLGDYFNYRGETMPFGLFKTCIVTVIEEGLKVEGSYFWIDKGGEKVNV